MRILYKYPSRSRPEKFFQGVENIVSLARHNDYEILATFDIDDSTMANEAVKERLNQYPMVRAIYGTSDGKLHACNRDMEFSGSWDIGILFSDDMRFLEEGFDISIIRNMWSFFPDFDGVLHYPDSHARHELITMIISGRKYYDRFGYWYNPDYSSVWADNQFTWESIILNKHAFIPEKIFDHYHPAWGMAQQDALYLRNEHPSVYYKDQITYAKNKEQNFGLYKL